MMGENKMKVFVTKEFRFEAAHNLPHYDGACSRLHGHSYKMQVTVSRYPLMTSSDNAQDCMVLDFKELKSIVKENVIDKLDHSYLNDFWDIPTAEVMVVSIFNTIKNLLPADVVIESVKLWETEDSYAECKRGD